MATKVSCSISDLDSLVARLPLDSVEEPYLACRVLVLLTLAMDGVLVGTCTDRRVRTGSNIDSVDTAAAGRSCQAAV